MVMAYGHIPMTSENIQVLLKHVYAKQNFMDAVKAELRLATPVQVSCYGIQLSQSL